MDENLSDLVNPDLPIHPKISIACFDFDGVMGNSRSCILCLLFSVNPVIVVRFGIVAFE